MVSPQEYIVRSLPSGNCSYGASEIISKRKLVGPIRLKPAQFKLIHDEYSLSVDPCDFNLSWSDCMRVCRSSRALTNGLPLSKFDAEIIALFKWLESDCHILIIANSYLVDKFSFDGLGIKRKLPLVLCGPGDVFALTASEWADYTYRLLFLGKYAEAKRPYVIVCGSSGISQEESKPFPMFVHRPDKGVSTDSLSWAKNLFQKWDRFCLENEHTQEPVALASKIELFLNTLPNTAGEDALEIIRMFTWCYAWAKIASEDDHHFCTIGLSGRVAIDTPQHLSQSIAEWPMKEFMGAYSQIGIAQTAERIRCLLQINSLSLPVLLDLFSAGFCWVGGAEKNGISWNSNGHIETFSTSTKKNYQAVVSDFVLLQEENRVDEYVKDAINNGDCVFSENPTHNMISLGVKHIQSIAEIPAQKISGKKVVLVGVPVEIPLGSLLQFLQNSHSVRLVLNNRSIASRLSDEGYIRYNQLVLSIAILQSKSKPITGSALELYKYIRRGYLIQPSRLKAEMDFYSSVLNGADLNKLAHHLNVRNSVEALQQRLYSAFGGVIHSNIPVFHSDLGGRT